MAMTKTYAVARKEFSYAGKLRDIGEVVELLGMRNDERLLAHKALVKYEGSAGGLPKCAECGAVFESDAARTVHGNKRH